ncbi:MAG: 5'-methylthioadenosine nucleosidase [Candidatus Puniceispirillaceae bacterium]
MIDLIVALEMELADITLPSGVRVTYCGVGKVNAALAAARVLALPDCRQVINYGTAGSLVPTLAGQLVRVATISQRDMDARPLAPLGSTPFEDGEVAGEITLGGEGARLSTGDNFVTSPPEVPSDIVDMEAYALAKACRRVGMPFECYKFVTDLADEDATANWRANVAKGAALFLDVLRRHGALTRV